MIHPSSRWCAVVSVLLLAALGLGCSTGEAFNPRVITLAMPSSPTSFDPRIGNDDASHKLHQLLFSYLVRTNERLEIVPEIATHWEMPDDRTYVVPLRRGVRFHDGRELTAADVVYTFSSLLEDMFVSPKKAAFRMVQSVTARDPYTVVFRLKEPFGSFPVNLVMAIIPEGSGDTIADRPIGSGPYQLVSFAVDDRFVLKPFRDYYDGPPANDGVILRIIPDDTMRGLELRKGTVDLVVNDLTPDIIYQLERTDRLQVTRSPGTDFMYVGLNLRHPALGNRRVRHALAHAINRHAIVDYLRRGLATPAVGILPPASPYFEPNVFTPTYDPARARVLLDEAGYHDPDGDGAQPRLRLTLKTSTSEYYRLQGAVIQQDLRRVGIDIDVRSYEFATLYSDVLRGNFEMFTLQWVGVSDPDILRRVFHTRQMPPAGYNRGSYSNIEADRLIDAATVSTDEAERRRLYAQAQQIIAWDAPYISLWYKTNVAIARAGLRGIRLSPATQLTFLKDVYR